MQIRRSDYTEQDKQEIAEYLKTHPDCFVWGTLEGLSIPMHLIKDKHLDNIIKHMYDHNFAFTPLMIKMFEAEQKWRRCATPAGRVLYGDT